ncbi:MAG: hypothetical protein V4543_10885 [Bacteroidota bacterium]
MKNNIKKYLAAAFAVYLVLVCNVSFAQEPGDPGDLGPTPSASPAGVPVDGGASILAASGIGYAVKRFRARKAALKTNSN